ncbi:hypothetical protein BDB00DRAFT_862655 [Zychaea mexicana]|uniref:uncharacterized protein n=1 Tax=Zychaea mexicana TaxID=64656 RepID=UPI0022FE7031|nr:uncharacterized protein BDB00DRAFT_862655 [Zychaea mexicana]KAI9470448.1 hypothetical protein BDB00DRAFT_862655 [Zychaea mexicana]
MTLTQRLNDALNANSMLKAQIRKFESDAKLAMGTAPSAQSREVARAASRRGATAGQQQDELLRAHALAQLGLIEYLEGEDDLGAALERFKKQLEAELSDNSCSSSNNNNNNNNNGSTNDHT